MKKIMIVTNSKTGGGAERSMNLLASILNTNETPVILVPVNSGPEDFVKPKCETACLDRRWDSGIIQIVRAIFKFIRLVEQTNPHTIILNCDLPEFLGCFLSQKKYRIIVIEHNNKPFVNRSSLGKLIRIRLSGKAIFIAVSDHLRIWPKNLIPQKVIRNLVSPQYPNINLDQELNAPIKINKLCFIGRLDSQQKKPEVILDISQSTNIPAIIIGEGKAKTNLAKSILDRGLSVELLGFKENVWKELSSNDLLIIPSAFEGDGLVVIEAIFNNIPFLLSDIKEFKSFNLPEELYCKNIDEFIYKVNKYKSDLSNLLLTKIDRDRIINERSPENIKSIWADLLSKL